MRKNLVIPTEPIIEKGIFSTAEAELAGLLDKGVYKQYLRLMIWWRAFSIGAKRIGSDLMGGMSSPIELDDTGTYLMNESGKAVKIS